MIYPQDFETRVGFDRIRRQTETYCATRLAKEKLAAVAFSASYPGVESALAQADQMRTVLMMEADFPQDGYRDTDHFLGKVRVEGAWLDTAEIADLKQALEAVRNLVRFFEGKEDTPYPDLQALAREVQVFPAVLERIDRILDRFGKVKDTASAELASLRKRIGEREREVGKRLQQILKTAQAQGLVEGDISVSIREGRAVIPVPAANKRKIKGFVHDESATGKTAYIEPVEVVELNNELKELEYAERREIIRILTEFTAFLRPYGPELAASGDFLATIDLLRAKARVALEMNAVRPVLRETPGIEWKQARNPVLEQTLKREGKAIVPLDLTLTPEKRILVISGPNAGGKSVCLKTVGLLQYMLQCGFLVPVSENSEAGLFRDLFVDIGDQQSIDNDLSTYSSHLLNMKNVLRHSGPGSLVLIDEFGSGTEPALGGAIAEAILEKLEDRGVFGVITTHYTNLKYYASTAKGIVNGAMAFDVQNIRPLFRLETGKPGSSFAFEIARKSGLPEDIVQAAAGKIGSGQVNLEKQLREIARDKRYWESKRDRIRIAEKRTDELAEQYRRELEEVREQRNTLIREAKEEARRILTESNRLIENTIREIRESQAEKERTRQARAGLEALRQEVEQQERTAREEQLERKMQRLLEKEARRKERRKEPVSSAGSRPAETTPAVPLRKETVEPGDKVRMRGQELMGEVLAVNGKKATVAFGQLSSVVSVDRLEAVSNAEYKRAVREKPVSAFTGGMSASGSVSASYDVSEKRLSFKSEIDVRGMRVTEALGAVQALVDEAVMLGMDELRILHGKGTGALKEEIRKYLRATDLVESVRDEHEQFGGAGITVVKLDL